MNINWSKQSGHSAHTQMSICGSYLPKWSKVVLLIENKPPAIIGVLHRSGSIDNKWGEARGHYLLDGSCLVDHPLAVKLLREEFPLEHQVPVKTTT